ncbi:hypothetical protein D3C87_1174170 [compost metagenome]
MIAFAFGGDAVNGDFRAVDRDRPGDTDLRAELVHQVHVRVQAQVARVLDHPVGAGLAEVLRQLIAALVQWTVLGVGPTGPEQHVALVEGIETTALLGPAAGAHGRIAVAGLALLALVLGGRVVPVHGADVVAVGAVFRSEFPVAFVDVAGGATQHFQAIGGLVDDHVDDLRRLAQVLDQWQHIGLEAAEQEAAIGLETRDFGQVVGAFTVEARRVAGVGRILDLEQLAGVVEGPAVERAGVGAFVAGLVPAQGRAAMTAGVDEGVEHTVLVARDEDRLAPHGGGVEIVDVGDLAFVGQVEPVALEDVFHLQVEQPGVGEHLAFAAIEALLGIVFKQGMHVFGSQGHGRRLHCYCSGRGHARTGRWGGISAGCRPLSVLCSHWRRVRRHRW